MRETARADRVFAALGTELPDGRWSLAAPNPADALQERAQVRALQRALQTYPERLVSCAVAHDAPPASSRVLEGAGLRRICEMVCAVGAPWEGPIASWPSGWAAQTPAEIGYGAFARALRTLQRETLDVPELTGLGTPEQLLATVLATVDHRPETWWHLSDSEGLTGLVLFDALPEGHWGTFLGIVPRARRGGYGMQLLRAGLGRAGAGRTITFVDERNAPARRLFARLGFQESPGEIIWIRDPQ